MRKFYLVFDAYGTLLKVNSSIAGLSKEKQELSNQIQGTWRAKQLEYTWLNSLIGKFEGFNRVTRQALDYAFNYHRCKDDALKELILSIFDEPTAFEDAVRFLDQIKSMDLQTAILSNGEQEKLQKSIRIAGIQNQIDEILSADEVQVFKPSPSVYQLVVQKFDCQPSEVLFFSSNPWDVAGATSFGFKTIWINRQGIPFDELGVLPSFQFKSFDALNYEDVTS